MSQWHFYADLMQELGIDVYLANPPRVKAIASARVKTDAIDAGVLCDLLRANLLPEAYFSPPEVRRWKELVRLRSSLVCPHTQVRNKVSHVLFKNALTHRFSSLHGVAGRQWLASLALPAHYAESLRQYLSLHDTLTRQISEVEALITRTVTEEPQAKLLPSIPGVGYISALTIMAEISDVNRFPSARHLMGYAGLVPSTYASGEKSRHGRITKQGSRWLRYTMVEIAQRQPLCKKHQGLGAYYAHIKRRKGAGTAAVATARKLLAVVWRILKDNRPFESMPPQSEGQEAHLHSIVSSS